MAMAIVRVKKLLSVKEKARPTRTAQNVSAT